uniref:Uncharacterized protein n=1 Tax=viral metagenome TaxID=1070528 RepID=A0A6C0JY11_9ZZZZ
MNRIFDYNGAAVSHSKPVKQLKTVKKWVTIDSGDRDVKMFPYNGDFVVYLPRVYENIVKIRLAGAEFHANPLVRSTGAPAAGIYYILELEGLNKTDECSVGADRSGYPDGFFAKIPVSDVTRSVLYNDHSAPENVGHYTPPVGKIDRLHVRTRLHNQKQSADYIYWSGSEFSLTFELEMLENVFDDFSSFESRIADRAVQ